MEQAAVNRKVGGSNPLSGAIVIKRIGPLADFLLSQMFIWKVLSFNMQYVIIIIDL